MGQAYSLHVAVVGGGIAGLSAALELRRQLGPAARVSVLESTGRLGGKLRVGELAGTPFDEGAESMLARRPEAVELARDVGLGDDLVHPATTRAWVRIGPGLRPMPARTVMGVPADLRALAAAGVLTVRGLARVPLDHVLPASGLPHDVPVGRYVAARVGREVVDRLVEPMLAGVYAGGADRLSLRATAPALAARLAEGGGLLAAAARVAAPAPARGRPAAPVLAGLRGGVGRLVPAVAGAAGAHVYLDTTVRDLQRRPDGRWRLVTGPAPAPAVLDADAVVVAVPAPAAARLLRGAAPRAAADLGLVDYASVAVVSLAFPQQALPGPLPGSGFLVPAAVPGPVKAVTFSSAKWEWVAGGAPGLVLLRASLGRHGQEAALQRDDAELVAAVSDALAEVAGVDGRPVDARVVRWGGSLPQYAVGHLDLVARVRSAVAAVPGLEVCGAALDGVGVPACVGGARAAVTRLLRRLAAGGSIGT